MRLNAGKQLTLVPVLSLAFAFAACGEEPAVGKCVEGDSDEPTVVDCGESNAVKLTQEVKTVEDCPGPRAVEFDGKVYCTDQTE